MGRRRRALAYDRGSLQQAKGGGSEHPVRSSYGRAATMTTLSCLMCQNTCQNTGAGTCRSRLLFSTSSRDCDVITLRPTSPHSAPLEHPVQLLEARHLQHRPVARARPRRQQPPGHRREQHVPSYPLNVLG